MEPLLETVQFESNHTLKVRHIRCKTFQEDHNLHYHPECELTYILKGSGTRCVGDNIEPFEPNDLVMIGPNLPHRWISNENTDGTGLCEMLVLQFPADCFGEKLLGDPGSKRLHQLLESANKGFKLSSDASPYAATHLRNVQHTQGLRQLSAFIALLDTLCLAPKKHLNPDTYKSNHTDINSLRIAKVTKHVKRNLSASIKQTEVADLVCMTPQSFSRFFRGATGRTFVSFVNELRIEEACKQLASTTNDIIDIAYECGYGNLSNFNRRFSQIQKCTPSEYRKKHLQRRA
ncbi:AraC family transcriptional regulator [Saccharophagus degradans]|uniref:AraC family transcriptional regulator n=1 Tax=Saccharophagus degradans TaxID=86304 RepID=UPI001C08013C|nr:AraC family transcriptional regulator [Saccharophagus degradans]MBU2987683.1 AraC family transcriptional regulator [Saccharophagus degradans]